MNNNLLFFLDFPILRFLNNLLIQLIQLLENLFRLIFVTKINLFKIHFWNYFAQIIKKIEDGFPSLHLNFLDYQNYFVKQIVIIIYDSIDVNGKRHFHHIDSLTIQLFENLVILEWFFIFRVYFNFF